MAVVVAEREALPEFLVKPLQSLRLSQNYGKVVAEPETVVEFMICVVAEPETVAECMRCTEPETFRNFMRAMHTWERPNASAIPKRGQPTKYPLLF